MLDMGKLIGKTCAKEGKIWESPGLAFPNFAAFGGFSAGIKQEEAYRACQGEVHSHPKIRDFRFYVRESQRPPPDGHWLFRKRKLKSMLSHG